MPGVGAEGLGKSLLLGAGIGTDGLAKGLILVWMVLKSMYDGLLISCWLVWIA